MLSVSDYLQKIISYQKLDLMASGLEFWRTRRKLRTKLLFVFKADILNAYPVVAWHFGGRYSRRRFFDETLVRYGLMEDTDISKQVLNVGYKIYYHASAMLVHNESPKNRLNYRQWAEMTVVNYDYLFRKSWSKDKWRWAAYYWALLGLIVVNLTKREALRGTLNGIRNLKGR